MIATFSARSKITRLDWSIVMAEYIRANLPHIVYNTFEVITVTTGQRIKKRRKQLGISAEKLAEIINVSPATVYRYENGDIEKVPGDRLTSIAEALSTNLDYLTGWENPCSTGELIEVYVRGAKSWVHDRRFNEVQKHRINEYLADAALKLKQVVNALADAEQQEGKILPSPSLCSVQEDAARWVGNALRYVNNDFSEDPFDEQNITAQYLEAIRKLSRRDQIAWLIRIQDYIEDSSGAQQP